MRKMVAVIDPVNEQTILSHHSISLLKDLPQHLEWNMLKYRVRGMEINTLIRQTGIGSITGRDVIQPAQLKKLR